MRRDDVSVRTPSASARVLAWAGLSAADLDPCTHRPADRREERRRRTFTDPAPCAKCAAGGTSFPQLLDTGPEELRWLPLCSACGDELRVHLHAIADRMYGIRR